ncbi:unnamed protein product [Diamesa tonsa]
MITFFVLTVVLCVLFLLWIIQYRVKRKDIYELAGKLPGLKEYPIIGHGYKFLNKDGAEVYEAVTTYNKKCGSVCSKIWLGPELLVILSDPDDVQTILNSPNSMEKADFYDFFQCTFGLFTSAVKIWKTHRKPLNQSFSVTNVQSFVPIFNRNSSVLLDVLNKEAAIGEHFDVYPLMSRASLDMILCTSLGVDFKVQTDKNCKLMEALEALEELINTRMFTVWHHSDFIYKFTSGFRKELHYRDELNKTVMQVVKKMKNTEIDEEDGPKIFIKQLLKLKKQQPDVFHEQAILDEILTFIVAGTETTAVTLSWTLLMIAMHPEVQNKMMNELDHVLGNSDDITYEDTLELNYMEQVIKESLRIYTFSPVLLRKTTGDVQLKNIVIPKGVTLAIDLHNLHRGEDCYKEPNEFNPDHFASTVDNQRHLYSFIPFSCGPRNCVGMRYAWISMKVQLAHILRKFKVTTDLKREDLRLKFYIVLKLDNKHMIRLEPRC